ncbi:MAG: secretin N-terminal domain-containing protein [Terrimicrobiaceae bacterium]
MKTLRFLTVGLLGSLLFAGVSLRAQNTVPLAVPPIPPPQGDAVNIQFPKSSVLDVLALYESLTGKRMIRDSNLAGPELSIMVSQPVPRAEAIRIIESSLLLNGYTIVPVDQNTIKILGPARMARSEGLPLFTEISQITNTGDQVVSFFVPLKFIAPQEAAGVITGVVPPNAYGSIVPVPTANAIIITDKTPVILKALGIVGLIDQEPAKVVTRFIQLQRADAEKVVETLNEMFGTADPNAPVTTAPANAPPPTTPEGDPSAAVGAVSTSAAQYEDRLLQGKSRFIADKRTNRVLVVTRTENYRYLSEVIGQLDAAGSFEQPLVKVLNYLSVNDAFPVLESMLQERGETTAGTAGQNQGQQPSTINPNQGGGFQDSGRNNSGGGGGLGRPDRLSDEALQSPPLAATLGNVSIIGDTSANSIIVYGPPDAKERAKQILDLLDKRPRQVYLAAVIGQLRIGDNMDYGVSYLVRYQNFSPIRNIIGETDESGAAGSVLSPRLFPGIDALPDPSSLLSPETFAQLSGLTIYGSIAESVDVFARFLETTNRFTTLSRPVVYTTNNKKATILSGQRVPVPVSTLTSTTPGLGDNNSVTSNIQYEDVVLKLEVVPLINSDNEVNLIIAQTNDNIVGSELISGNEVPIIATQEITTSVRVKSGSTIVLGGLITDDDEKNTDGIPYLNRIPVVGPIFGGSASKRKSRSELIVMIQPIVVDSEIDSVRASDREGGRTILGEDAHALAAQPAEFHRAAPATEAPTPKPKSWFPWSKPKN